MAERKHTPGPWFYRRAGCKIVAPNAKGWKRNVAKLVIAEQYIGGRDEQDIQADGELIASAPDLLAERDTLLAVNANMKQALEGLGALPDGYCFCFNSHRDASKPEDEHTGECRAARAALSKARGDT